MFRPELVIFDLDGTLIEFHHDYLYDETDRIILSLGYDPVPRSVLCSSFEAFDYFRFVLPGEREVFSERFWQMFDWGKFPQPKPLASSHQTLASLREKGVKVAVATARAMSVAEVRKILRDTGLLEHVSYVATRETEETHWMDKTGLISEVCRELEVLPAKSVMVGDNPTDIASASAVGVGLTVAVLSGGIRRDVLERSNPDFILPDVGALPDAIFGDNCYVKTADTAHAN
jgi:phosphoglycolate phosphatase-like HAD superfamily hydrolase